MLVNVMNSYEIIDNVASARRAYARAFYDDATVLYTAFSADQYLADRNFDIEVLFEVLLAIYMSENTECADDYLQKIRSAADIASNSILKTRYHIALGEICQAKSRLQEACDSYEIASKSLSFDEMDDDWKLRCLYGEMRALLEMGYPGRVLNSCNRFEEILISMDNYEQSKWNVMYLALKGHSLKLVGRYQESFSVLEDRLSLMDGKIGTDNIELIEAHADCIALVPRIWKNEDNLDALVHNRYPGALDILGELSRWFAGRDQKKKKQLFMPLILYIQYLKGAGSYRKLIEKAEPLVNYFIESNYLQSAPCIQVTIMYIESLAKLKLHEKTIKCMDYVEQYCSVLLDGKGSMESESISNGRILLKFGLICSEVRMRVKDAKYDKAGKYFMRGCEILKNGSPEDIKTIKDLLTRINRLQDIDDTIGPRKFTDTE